MHWRIRYLTIMLVWLMGFVFIHRDASAEPRLALVIANGAYAGGLDPLANPVNDGKLIAGTLQKLGFIVTLVTDADQKKMKRAVSDFGEALGDAGPTASALFYYAGHGLQVGGQNYLVPVNADIRREADVDLEAVSAEAVLKQMEYAAPSTSIVILDACRNNPLSRGMRSATRGLARMDAPNGSYVAYSTAPGQTAADGTGKNSPFATALVAEMVKPGQGIEESFRNVRVNVSTATNGEQTPWDSSSLMSSFYFAGEKQVAAIAPTPAPAPAPPPVAAPAAVSVEPSAAEMAFWDSVKNSTEPGDYAAYLAQYPDGSFAKLADSRQKSLEAKAATRTATQVAAVTPSPVAPVPTTPTPAALPEPEFESPLADGTIVLSPKVKAALDEYLAQSHAGQGNSTLGFFYVSVDGRAFGQSICNNPGRGGTLLAAPVCPPQRAAVAGDSGKAKAKTRAACDARAKTACVLLFAGDSQKNDFKPLQ
jgi:uncharacterized caspase-like protein